jgi:hypothetical protein
MSGIDQHQLEVPGQAIIDGTPEHSGALHAHVAAAFFQQPLPHGQQLWGDGAEGPDLFATLPRFDDRDTGHHHVAMDIQPTATRIKDFHGSSPFRNASSALMNARRGQGVSVGDQFHLHAGGAISGGSARHLGTSWESKLARIKFTLVLSLPLFFLSVYPFSSRVARLRRMMSWREKKKSSR